MVLPLRILITLPEILGIPGAGAVVGLFPEMMGDTS
jgi:hypothetical protein